MLKERQITRFDNLDGLRAIGCLGIIAMHIKANADYQTSSYIYNNMVSTWTVFVYLFLIISGFGMFCGYYEKIKNREIDINQFYLKRYKKLLPFFAFLLVIDVVMERSLDHLIEAFTELTMIFGLLPNNNPNAIGVSWTLGVIFLFYMLMPFFVFLCYNRIRALLSLAVSVVLVYFCDIYYFTDKFVVDSFIPRHSFLYCAPYFLAGACIYLYRNEIIGFVKRFRWLVLALNIALTVLYYMTPIGITGVFMTLKHMVLFVCWVGYFISFDSKALQLKPLRFIGGISMEMYLAQMVVFRALEKVGLLYIFGKGMISFLFIFVLMVAGLIAFICTYNFCFNKIKSFFSKKTAARRTANEKQ